MERVARRARAMVLAAVAVTAFMPLLPSSGASHGKGCTISCGNISIPYPFGVEPGCYHDGGFNLTCNKSYDTPKLFLGDGTVQVLDISIPNGTLSINSTKLHFKLDTQKRANGTWRAAGLGYHGGPYFLAAEQNNIVALGCGIQVNVLRENNTLVSSCANFCPAFGTGTNGSILVGNGGCNGVGCCQSSVVGGVTSYELQLRKLDFGSSSDPYVWDVQVFMMDSELTSSIKAAADMVQDDSFLWPGENHTIPAVLGWRISSSVCPREGSSSPSGVHQNSDDWDTIFPPQEPVLAHGSTCININLVLYKC